MDSDFFKLSNVVTVDILVSYADWDGGMVLVSHDFRLISQVAKEIWEVANGMVKHWKGDIQSYKDHLKKQFRRK